MAVSAELSMKQAVALSQQQEIREKELQVRDLSCSHSSHTIHPQHHSGKQTVILVAHLSLSFPLFFPLFLSLSTDRNRRSVSKIISDCASLFKPISLAHLHSRISQGINTEQGS